MALTAQSEALPASAAALLPSDPEETVNLNGISSHVSNGEFKVRSRGYQLEMLDASMERNIIVTMDTGSGKTHVAILRIMAELDRCPSWKLVWFLVPSVALCKQQFEVVRKQLPAVRVKMLTGDDNVEHWSEQRIWDAVLEGVQVVVSTHAVLADALAHGFVTMSRLALLIFDEAHSCVGGHPANKIMKTFYHPTLEKSGSATVPHILGLTASPVVRSKVKDLVIIESNLASIASTPRINRTELLEYVFPPTIQKIDFKPSILDFNMETTPNFYNLLTLEAVAMGRLPDPFNHKFHMKIDPRVDSNDRLWIESQLKKICGKAQHVFEELGPWAVEYYVATSVKQSLRSKENSKWKNKTRKDHISNFLEGLPITYPDSEFNDKAPLVSEKLGKLIDFLEDQSHTGFSGLIFVEQRATVFALGRLLAIHPSTKGRFACGTFVGSINSKNELGDLDPRGQETTLEDFRTGLRNLVVATSVLEEGIDVSACNMVICFELPKNLKSFVQRRGRARKEESVLVAMLPEGDPSGAFEKWQTLEKEMIKAYRDEMRTLLKLAEIENVDEEDDRILFVESTQARLTVDSATSHLEHFCASLPTSRYVNNRPSYSFKGGTGHIRCDVILPNAVDITVRCASSKFSWITERKARKDAAFEAYKALYEAGLVNDNLLPLYSDLESTFNLEEIETHLGVVEVSAQFNPWIEVARMWDSGAALQSHQLTIRKPSHENAESLVQAYLILPCSIPYVSIDLFIDDASPCSATLSENSGINGLTQTDISALRSATNLVLATIPRHEPDYGIQDFAILFTPVQLDCINVSLNEWIQVNTGEVPLSEVLGSTRDAGLVGHTRWGKSFLVASREEGGDLRLLLRPIPRRRNFLVPGTRLVVANISNEEFEGTASDSDDKSKWVSSDGSHVDKLPSRYAILSLLIPSILHRLQVVITAEQAQETVLGFRFNDLALLITAISAPTAGESSNYQRLEFLGDTILKFVVAQSLFMENKTWHEGYLSASKDRMVSNARLAKAALETGLDRYILTNRFTGRKWKPPLISDLLKEGALEREKRWMSTKVLADVVEAIIGAAYLDDGQRRAVPCIQTFIPEIKINLLSMYGNEQRRPAKIADPIHLQNLERFLDYTFHDKSLLVESITHPSYDADLSHASYQRLEFLGDAVLDMVLVDYLFHHPATLSEANMHILKTGLVNKDFLGFLCLEANIDIPTANIVETRPDTFTIVQARISTSLWQFMRHHSAQISQAQTHAHAKYLALRDSLRHSLTTSRNYPWCALLALNAEKFLSDIVESLFGAIFLDAGGDLVPCMRFAERLGMMELARRFVDEQVDLLHPKNRLGMVAGTRTVEYVRVDGSGVGEEGDEQMGTVECVVQVEGVEVWRIRGGVSRDEMEARAAEGAIEALERRGPV